MDPGGAGRVHDDDRIRLRRRDAPVELEAQAAVGAWRVADVLLRPFDLHEAERDGFGDALGVVRRALAVEDGAHGLAARSGRARVPSELPELIRRPEEVRRVDPALEAERVGARGAVVRGSHTGK